jgi:hypothetical protein
VVERQEVVLSESAVSYTQDAEPEPDRGRGLLAYVLLAYGLSWAWLVPLAMTGLVVLQGQGWPTHFPALIGPMVAAILVAARTGTLRRLLLTMVRVRVALRWWVGAVSPLVLLGIGLVAEMIAGAQLPQPTDFAQMTGLPSVIGVGGVVVLVMLVNGSGRKPGGVVSRCRCCNAGSRRRSRCWCWR